MAVYVQALGINQYRPPIQSLLCCERDARAVVALLKEGFDFHAEYLEERKAEDVLQRIEALEPELKPGDTYVFYFSGHGKALKGDHLLLLPGATQQTLELAQGEAPGLLSFNGLEKRTSGGNWASVQRLFILDACRTPLQSGKAGDSAVCDAKYLLRDVVLKRRTRESKSVTVLNSCELGAAAAELPDRQGHGLFTGALLHELRLRKGSRQVHVDAAFTQAVAQKMRSDAKEAHLPETLEHQPALCGPDVLLYAPTSNLELAPTLPSTAGQPDRKAGSASASLAGSLWPKKPLTILVAACLLVLGGSAVWKLWTGATVGDVAGNSEPTVPAVASAPRSTVNPAEAERVLAIWRKGGDSAKKASTLPVLKQLVEQGQPEAQGLLAWAFLDGEGGLPQDPSQALILARKAAAAEDGRAMNVLGFMYQSGRGGLQTDSVQAVNWFQKAAQAGYAGAMANLGYMQSRGLGGLAKSDVQAVAWYRKGAEAGDGGAMVNLGFMYSQGRGGLKQDDVQAVSWFQKGAEAGDGGAMNSLGQMYFSGRGGLPLDRAAAVEWFQKGSQAGDPGAELNLGRAYERGEGGLAKDVTQAIHWYRQAARHGEDTALQQLRRLGACALDSAC